MRIAVAIAVGLASLLLAAPDRAPQRVVSMQVAARVSIDDPDVYVVIVVFDPHVAEIQNSYLVLSDRPARGHIDWFRSGPKWDTVAPGPPNALDIRDVQLVQVERGIEALGFAQNAIHGWVVSAPVVSAFELEYEKLRSLRVGEVLIDLGPASQARAQVARFTQDPGAVLSGIETQAGVHLAFSQLTFYRPNCSAVAKRSQDALEAQARVTQASLEGALGMHLQYSDVQIFPSLAVLCPDIRPVTIYSTDGWVAPTRFAGGAKVIVGTAHYAMGANVPRAAATPPPGFAIEMRQPDIESIPSATPGADRVATIAAATVSVQPTSSLLSFTYANVELKKIAEKISALAAIGIYAEDVYPEPSPSGDDVRVWIRFAPHTNARAQQIERFMKMGAEPDPYLSLFTADCSSPAAAIVAAYARDRERAAQAASELHADLGKPLSIAVTIDEPGNATCGLPITTGTKQLARSVILGLEPFPPFPEPMRARFPVRVDVVWSLVQPHT